MKRSGRGTAFFAHKSTGTCTTAPETEEHLQLKQIAMAAARAAGWYARTEVSGTTPSGANWRADVLADKGPHRIAIEVQWSAQDEAETRRRQARYKDAGICGLWLFRQKSFPQCEQVPEVQITVDPQRCFIAQVQGSSDGQVLPIGDFLTAALTERFKWGVPIGVPARIALQVGSLSCWQCGADTAIITSVGIAVGPVRHVFTVSDLGEQPGLYVRVCKLLCATPYFAMVARRFSQTVGEAYLANGCAHCGALIGRHYECEAWNDQQEVAFALFKIDADWQQMLMAPREYASGWAVYD